MLEDGGCLPLFHEYLMSISSQHSRISSDVRGMFRSWEYLQPSPFTQLPLTRYHMQMVASPYLLW